MKRWQLKEKVGKHLQAEESASTNYCPEVESLSRKAQGQHDWRGIGNAENVTEGVGEVARGQII